MDAPITYYPVCPRCGESGDDSEPQCWACGANMETLEARNFRLAMVDASTESTENLQAGAEMYDVFANGDRVTTAIGEDSRDAAIADIRADFPDATIETEMVSE